MSLDTSVVLGIPLQMLLVTVRRIPWIQWAVLLIYTATVADEDQMGEDFVSKFLQHLIRTLTRTMADELPHKYCEDLPQPENAPSAHYGRKLCRHLHRRSIYLPQHEMLNTPPLAVHHKGIFWYGRPTR